MAIALINTMDNTREDAGHILSFHKDYETAQARSQKIQPSRDGSLTKSYIPTAVVEVPDRKYKVGEWVKRWDAKDAGFSDGRTLAYKQF